MFRLNVAALIQFQGQFVGFCRSDHSTWQCVQGGIEQFDESPIHAIQREMKEELGLEKKEFKIIYESKYWRRYYFTKKILNKKRYLNNLGQEQKWFLIEISNLDNIDFNFDNEFTKYKIMTIQELLSVYSVWKKSGLYDFCRELELVV